jgi:hypothetical protein
MWQKTQEIVVGVAGFEPAASCSQGTRANQAALHPATSLYSTRDIKSQESLEEETNCRNLFEGIQEIIFSLG